MTRGSHWEILSEEVGSGDCGCVLLRFEGDTGCIDHRKSIREIGVSAGSRLRYRLDAVRSNSVDYRGRFDTELKGHFGLKEQSQSRLVDGKDKN